MTVVKLPVPEDGMSVEELVDIIALYRKELMFVLQNLDSDNINSLDGDTVDVTNTETIISQTIFSETIITKTLYADRANISELTVDELKTAQFAQNYLDSDTSDINYIYIHEQTIEYINASTTGASTVQMQDRDGNNLYWTDNTNLGVTTDVTSYPVLMYVYSEDVKMKMKFELVSGTYEPVITFGVGSGVGDNRKGFIWKDTDGLRVEYQDTSGNLKQIQFTDSKITFDTGTSVTELSDGEYLAKSNVGNKIHVTDTEPSTYSSDDIWIKEVTQLELLDGMAEPDTISGKAQIYIDNADNLLKIKRSDGTVKKFDLST